jgi:hypothetical protein
MIRLTDTLIAVVTPFADRAAKSGDDGHFQGV